jgi:hypothetical protein
VDQSSSLSLTPILWILPLLSVRPVIFATGLGILTFKGDDPTVSRNGLRHGTNLVIDFNTATGLGVRSFTNSLETLFESDFRQKNPQVALDCSVVNVLYARRNSCARESGKGAMLTLRAVLKLFVYETSNVFATGLGILTSTVGAPT